MFPRAPSVRPRRRGLAPASTWTPATALGGVSLLLAACGSSTPATPVATNVSVAPRVVDPGQTFQVSYRVDNSTAQLARAELVGLPPNTLAAGTGPILAVPPATNVIQRTDVMLRQPAKDGVYPLSLRLTTRDGRVSDTPIGTLTVNNVPARIEHVQVNPSNHRVAACAGQPVPINVSYTVSDPNGAIDLRDPRILQVQGVSTLGGTVGAPYPMQTASTALPANGYTIVNPAGPLPTDPPPVTTTGTVTPRSTGATSGTLTPGNTVVAPSSGPVPLSATAAAPARVPRAQVATAPGGTIVLPPGGVQLSPPTRADTVQETVTTPLTIACSLAAPAQWDWVVQGSDDDPMRNQIVPTNQANAKYFTSQ